MYREEWAIEREAGTPAWAFARCFGVHRSTHWRWLNPRRLRKRLGRPPIAEERRAAVAAMDRRYRSSWDARSVAHVTGVGKSTVAKLLAELRGPRPRQPELPHTRRTRILRPDVMWATDFMDLPGGRALAKTIDEASRYRPGWETARGETATAAVKHAQGMLRRTSRWPLVWKHDGGKAFTGEEFQGMLAAHGIVGYPTAPRAPWTNGRVERDHREIQNWLATLDVSRLSDAALEKEIDDGMIMLNFVKPRAVLGYQRSAEVYFAGRPFTEAERKEFVEAVRRREDLLMKMGPGARRRMAVRLVLKEFGLLEEWEVERREVLTEFRPLMLQD